MVSLEQVSQYTVISAWNSMITPAVKWFVNGDIMTTNKLPGMYFFLNWPTKSFNLFYNLTNKK
jgi:hypothetical protein